MYFKSLENVGDEHWHPSKLYHRMGSAVPY
jgi:hypothetical protein